MVGLVIDGLPDFVHTTRNSIVGEYVTVTIWKCGGFWSMFPWLTQDAVGEDLRWNCAAHGPFGG
jgi:hypothetical protein